MMIAITWILCAVQLLIIVLMIRQIVRGARIIRRIEEEFMLDRIKGDR